MRHTQSQLSFLFFSSLALRRATLEVVDVLTLFFGLSCTLVILWIQVILWLHWCQPQCETDAAKADAADHNLDPQEQSSDQKPHDRVCGGGVLRRRRRPVRFNHCAIVTQPSTMFDAWEEVRAKRLARRKAAHMGLDVQLERLVEESPRIESVSNTPIIQENNDKL